MPCMATTTLMAQPFFRITSAWARRAMPDLSNAPNASPPRKAPAPASGGPSAPCLAVPQDAHWGRTYEGYSDDPALVSELGAAATIGFQGGKLSAEPTSVLACAKH